MEEELVRKTHLLELVIRDMPMKKEYDINGWAVCPSCHKVIGDGNFCRYCGQRLDNGTE